MYLFIQIYLKLLEHERWPKIQERYQVEIIDTPEYTSIKMQVHKFCTNTTTTKSAIAKNANDLNSKNDIIQNSLGGSGLGLNDHNYLQDNIIQKALQQALIMGKKWTMII